MFTGMHRHRREGARSRKRRITSRHIRTSVIVHNFHFIGVAVVPSEADAPLIVDPNTMPAFTVPLQPFEPVARWGCQLFETLRRVQLLQLAHRHSLNRPKPAMASRLEQLPRGSVAVSPNHHLSILRRAYYVNVPKPWPGPCSRTCAGARSRFLPVIGMSPHGKR